MKKAEEFQASELEPVFFMRIGTEKKFADDYSFEFGGKIYHVNKQLKEQGRLLLFKILDAFDAERKKVEKLERKVDELRLKIKAARYDGFVEGQKFAEKMQSV